MLDLEELSAWPEYVRIFLGLVALVPPPLMIPIFVSIVAGRSRREMRIAAAAATSGFFITMTAFAFFGSFVLTVFGISLPAFRMAGGFLLLLIGLDLIRGDTETGLAQAPPRQGTALTLGIVPLCMPVMAGPGALSAVVLFASEHDGITHKILMMIVIAAVALMTYVLFRLAILSQAIFTRSASIAFNKVMGLLMCAIAFEFFMGGISAFIPAGLFAMR